MPVYDPAESDWLFSGVSYETSPEKKKKKKKKKNRKNKMRPPVFVKRLHVENKTDHCVKLTAVFGTLEQQQEMGTQQIVETCEVPPNGSKRFDEHIFEMENNSWQATAPFVSLQVEPVEGHASNAALPNLRASRSELFEPQVQEIVDLLQLQITKSAEHKFQVHQ